MGVGTSRAVDRTDVARWLAGVLAVVLALVALPACGADEPASGTELPSPDGAEAACERPNPEALEDGRITSGGDVRRFEIVVPPGDLAEPRPLVLNLHGARSTATFQHQTTGLDRLAEREGFVLVSPDSAYEAVDDASWDIGRTGKDIPFLHDLLDEVEANLCIDRSRVYVTGFSQGGILSLVLACDRPERFAAVAPVAGLVDVEPCASDEPVPVLAVHGTADQAVGYDGRLIPFLMDYVEGPPVPEVAAAWARRNGCDDAVAIVPGPGPVDRQRYDCPGGVVELVTLVGAAHGWPKADDRLPGMAADETTGFDASEEIWRFFDDQSRAG